MQTNPCLMETGATRNYLGFEEQELQELGGLLTAKEITQQPLLWKATFEQIQQSKDSLQKFLDPIFLLEDLTVILTGAGSSAYIGSVLQGPFQKYRGKPTLAIATTDLISHPAHYFRSASTLLISFARSGESPESLAAVNLANTFCSKVFHLIITCNPQGKLAKDQQIQPGYVFILPPGSDDQGLAMTGSFTAMLLAGLLICRLPGLNLLYPELERLCDYGCSIIRLYGERLRKLAQLPFERVIFLGSGPLQAIANESALKVQELTDGKIICKHESFLGFRHGPKAIINNKTLLIYLLSNNEYVLNYETDLIIAINSGQRGILNIGVMEHNHPELNLDLNIIFQDGTGKIDEDLLAVCSVLPAQLLGFYASIAHGLSPDTPSKSETITRIVRGVNIYPIHSEEATTGTKN